MARVDVPIERVNRREVAFFNTLTVVAGDTVDGMRLLNNGATLLYIDNNSGLAQTIDIYVVETVDFYPVSPVSIAIPSASTVNLIGPFPQNLYGNVLEFDVSSASLDFGAFSLL